VVTNALEDVAAELAELKPEVVTDGNAPVGGAYGAEFPYSGDLRLSNFVRFYHPDGTCSTIAAPTFNPKRPTPYLKRFLLHWLGKRGPNGELKWWSLKRQAPPLELPFRCFVEPGGRQCTKRLPTILDLYMHVQAKHGEESKMYADVLEAMKKTTQMKLDPELAKALGLAKDDTLPAAVPEAFYCRQEGCARFFDSESGRNQHEYTCPLKKKEAE